MSRVIAPAVLLIGTYAYFVVIVVAAPRQNAALEEQPSSSGLKGGAEVNEAKKWKWSGLPFSFFDTASGIPSSAVANAIGRGATDSRVAVGQSVSAVGTALGGSANVQVNAIGQGADARGLAVGGQATSLGSAVGGSASVVTNGASGGRASGRAIGGDASAIGNAVGGDAIVGGSDDDFELIFKNAFGSDFWASLRNPLNAGATSTANGATGRANRNAAVGGTAAAGGRAVGGSAVVVGGQGGRAVGGSASVFGNVGGTRQILSHSVGETSDVIGRVAAGGVATA